MVGINAANYLYQLVAARSLGPDDFGALAALIAVITVAGLPFGAVQLVVARSVAGDLALGQRDRAASFAGSAVGLTLVIGVITAAAGVLAAGPIAHLLQLEDDGATAVAVTALTLPFAMALPALLGVVQGEQRFRPYALAPLAGAMVRLISLVVLLIAGLALTGAVTATLIGTVVSSLAVLWPVRRHLRIAEALAGMRRILRETLRPAIGLLGIASLTNVDVVVVKGALSASDAGVLGATAIIAKLAVFVPSAIIVVLQPRVAARIARGRAADDILGRSVLVTLGFCAVFTVMCLAAAEPIVHLLYGSEFGGAATLLGGYAVFASVLSLVNVHLNYQLSGGAVRAPLLVGAFAAVHAVALVLFHRTVETVVVVNVAVAVGLLVAYEITQGSSLLAAARSARDIVSGLRADRAGRARLASLGRRAIGTCLRGVAVTATYAVVAVVVTWPLVTKLGDAVFGRGGDSFGTIWSLWSGRVNGRNLIGSDHVDYLGAPIGFTHDGAIDLTSQLVGSTGALLTSVTDEVVAYNLLILSGLALSGAVTYALARTLGAGRLPAWWAGMAFTIFPWHIERAAGSPSQTHLWALPLVALAAVGWYRSPTAARALLLGGALLVAMVTDFYLAFIAVVLTAVLLLAAGWAWRSEVGFAAAARRVVVCASATAWAPLIVFGYLLVARYTTGAEFIAGRGGGRVGELTAYGLRLPELVVPTYANPFVGDETRDYLVAHVHGSNFAEISLYVGWITLALASAGIAWGLRHRTASHVTTRFAWRAGVLAVATGLVLSMPSPLEVAGLRIPAPSRFIFEVAPYWRVYSRFVALIMLGLIILAVLALRRLEAAAPRRLAAAAMVVLIAGSAAELAHDLPVIDLPTTPEGYAQLSSLEPGAIVADYPLEASDEAGNSDRLFWQRVHHHPLLNGAPPGSRADALRETASSIDDPSVPGILAFARVRLVTIDTARTPATLTKIVDAASGPDVFRVVARPVGGVGLFRDGSYPAEVQPDGNLRRWLLTPGTVDVWVRRPGRYVAEFWAASYGVPRRLTLAAPGQDTVTRTIGANGGMVRVPLDLPAGITSVALTGDPGPVVIPDGRTVSIYTGNWILTGSGG
ncbi:MAG: oligosaccharide flippase family protein [Thermoleophilia bacterium]|nr:oligosaccharide flippase family protein [Thermoleophilia bacterium]